MHDFRFKNLEHLFLSTHKIDVTNKRWKSLSRALQMILAKRTSVGSCFSDQHVQTHQAQQLQEMHRNAIWVPGCYRSTEPRIAKPRMTLLVVHNLMGSDLSKLVTGGIIAVKMSNHIFRNPHIPHQLIKFFLCRPEFQETSRKLPKWSEIHHGSRWTI
jgi:hypothetical protein